MQVTVFSCRDFDEKELFLEYGKELGLDLVLCKEAPSLENVDLVKGSQCVDILTTKIDRNLARALKDHGVNYLITSTIG